MALQGGRLKSYTFKVVLERDRWPDEPDEKAVWRAYVPALEHRGASTWGYTREEALQNLQEILQAIVEEMKKEGQAIPPEALLQESDGPLITVVTAS